MCVQACVCPGYPTQGLLSRKSSTPELHLHSSILISYYVSVPVLSAECLQVKKMQLTKLRWFPKRKSMISCPDFEPDSVLRTHIGWLKRWPGHQKEEPRNTMTFIFTNDFSVLPQRNQWPFLAVVVPCGKVICGSIRVLSITGAELTVICGFLKHHLMSFVF